MDIIWLVLQRVVLEPCQLVLYFETHLDPFAFAYSSR